MKERVHRILNIKHSESSQVFDLLTVQFFIGLSNALVNIIALTLFIKNFPIQSLPLAYLVIAGALILFNFIYEKLEHKFSPLSLLKYSLGFTAVLLFFLWIGLTYGNSNDFIFILMVSGVLIYMANSYVFWGLVSLLFNVRESRRVFSIVGSGDIPAKLIGYIAAPLLIAPFGGIGNLIWLCVLSLCTGLFLFHRFTKKKTWDHIKKKVHGGHGHSEAELKKKDIVSFFFENKLIFTISLLSLLSYNVFALIDYTFISQVKHRFESIRDLAVYIALFFGFGRLIALGFKLIFTSRVIEKLGVIYCLFITPVALFLFCIPFFFTGDESHYNLFIFGLMAMLTEVLRSTMQEPVFFILFQPLKENLRLKGHMISKGYMYPPSLFIVGLSLLFFYNAGVEMTILLAVKIIIANLCIWAAVIFFMRRNYLSTIHASIKKGIFSSDDIYVVDHKTINILLNKISTGKKIEVIYALDLLEKSGYAGLPELLEAQLEEDRDLEVKKYALDRIEATEKVNTGILKDLLVAEQDTEMRQKLVGLLCKHDKAFLKETSEKINSYDYAVRKIIIINLLNQAEFNYVLTAGNEINQLLLSPNSQERILAVEIISELKHLQFSDSIERLVNDDDISVKRVAITAACKLRMKALLPSILVLLDLPEDKNIVLKGLQLYGEELFSDIKHLHADMRNKYMNDLIKIAGKIKGSHSTKFLSSKLGDEKIIPKDKILHALWLKEYEPAAGAETERFNSLLHHYLKMGLDKVKDYHHIPDFKDKDLIRRSIFSEVKSDLSSALKACALLFRKKEINRILELMEIYKHDKLYNAMEMLELVLPKKVSKELNLLFDFILDPHQSNTRAHTQEIKVLYNKVVFNAPLLFNPWTKAVCVYCSWKNHETVFLQRLKDHIQPDEHYLVKETRDFVMSAINN